MSAQQSKALLLADEIQLWNNPCARAANELRRLHSVNAELLQALKWIANRCPDDMLILPLNPIHQEASYDAGACSRAAIAKAQE